ncbi:MAG: RnfABCDGE type electron transport complex subunit D [Lachnospiraceae bacterium]|nr:RnfABCDGE type electron transport complex subunit D [Lachnospiraceae bacterium]
MNNKLKLSVSPHIHSGRSTTGIMRDVLLALLPATIAGTVIFGLRSLLVVAVCVAACVGFEALFNLIIKKEQTVGDLSAAVTGLLLALNLPANIPLWQCVVGSLFAIVVVKGLFGGIGCNPVNPAITARVFMLVAFGSMTVQAFPTVVDTVSSATPLSVGPEGTMPSLLELFLGLNGGAIGETCSLALLLGFVYLLVRRVITWQIPVSFIGTVYVCSFFMEGMDPVRALAMVLSGGLFIGAIFMATDYVTSPATPKGKLIFGVGAGLITFVIRYFGIYPEGVSFAILFMNILTPYISSWTRHKVFGVGGKKA